MSVKRMAIKPYASSEIFSARYLRIGQFAQIWEPGKCHHSTIVTKFYGNEFCAVWSPSGDEPFYTEWGSSFDMKVRPIRASEVFLASSAHAPQKEEIIMPDMQYGQIGEVISPTYSGAIVVRTYNHIVCIGGVGARPWNSVWTPVIGNGNVVRPYSTKKKIRLQLME